MREIVSTPMVHLILAARGNSQMNTAMEMHDSFLLEYERFPNCTGFVLFHAVVFRSDGSPAIDPGESGWQNSRMTFTDMLIEGSIPDHKPHAADGHLSVDGVRDDGLIPFPSRSSGEVVLSMVLSDEFATITIRASSILMEAAGECELERAWPPATAN